MERLNGPVFDGVGLSVIKRRVNASLFSLPILFLVVFYNSLSLFLHSVGWFGGVEVRLIGADHPLPDVHLHSF